MMHPSAIGNLERLEVLLRKKLLKKDCLEKLQTQNLALIDQIQIKNHLAIKRLLVKKNHLVTEKQVIESRLPNVNLHQKRLLKSQPRLEHLELPIQNQSHQNVKRAFKIITDFA